MFRLIPIAAIAASAVAVTAAAPAPHVPNIVNVVASEYSFDAPASIPAGYNTFRLTNKGKELHHIQLVRLTGGHTMADFAASMKPGGRPPAWVHFMGGPNAGAPGAGATEVTIDLAAGNYVMLCAIPSPDGTPHMMKGMVKPLTVTPVPKAERAKVTPPRADVNIRLSDYNFGIPKTVKAGAHTFRVTNTAAQPHEIFIIKLAPGKTAMDMFAWSEKPQGPPPGMPMGGTSAFAKGVVNLLTVDLEPGEYGMLCFFPDAKDGKPHALHGMASQFTVK